MQVIVEFTIVPIGIGTSVSKYVAMCVKLIQSAGLTYELHGYGTNIQGDWDVVLNVIKLCHEKLHAQGVPRIHTNLKIGTRNDREQTITDKVDSVRKKL